MLGLFVAGLVFLVVGLLGIGYGFPVKEFSFGNMLIGTGALAACTGAILIAIGLVIRELRALGRVFEATAHQDEEQDPFIAMAPAIPARPAIAPRVSEPVGRASETPPWQNERATRERVAPAVEPEPEPEPVPSPALEAARKRRNLLFTSTRREREAAEAGPTEAAPEDAPGAEPHPSFDDAWPADRGRGGLRRNGRPEPEAAKPAPPAPPPIRRPAEAPPVSILKSGVVDGMAYSLYSDGSIEAQMPEGMVRFSSIDELRKHLEQRGG